MRSRSSAQTHAIATAFIDQHTPQSNQATIVGLMGDLGSGKTTFVKGVAQALGITDVITSPTFVIEKIYKTHHHHFTHLVHIDAYRLENSAELVVLGFNDMAAHPKHLILIEWPERVQDILPPDTPIISFAFVDETTRQIIIPDGS